MPEKLYFVLNNHKKIKQVNNNLQQNWIIFFCLSTSIPVTVYAPKAEIHNADFALNLVVKSLDFFTELFGVPYSLPKCDVVSSPAMIGGAMENWGLLIHKSNLLLVDEEKSTMLSKEKFQICW